jgi:uncharacterized protein YkwD
MYLLACWLAVCATFAGELQSVPVWSAENTTASATSWQVRRVALAPPDQRQRYAELAGRVHREVNEFRREHALQPLTLHPAISEQAAEHSERMARAGTTISHHGFDERLRRLRKAMAIRSAAENVAVSSGFDDPARAVVDGWKDSAGHRKNMLGDFSLTGIGAAQSKDGDYFFTQIFIRAAR